MCKKRLILLQVVLLTFGLIACGSETSSIEKETNAVESNEQGAKEGKEYTEKEQESIEVSTEDEDNADG